MSTVPVDERTWPLKAWLVLRRLNLAHLVGLVLLVTGAVAWTNTLLAANLALDLQAHGRVATVAESEVFVSRGLNERSVAEKTEVSSVRVVLPGTERHVELSWISPPLDPRVPPGSVPGWIPATSETGYAAPLHIRYIARDGETVVMAQSDVEACLERDDGTMAWVTLAGALVFGLAFGPRLIRARAAATRRSRVQGVASRTR